MSDHLSKYFGVDEIRESLPIVQAESLSLDNDSEESKQNIKNLIETGNRALEEALNLAIESESPRAFEVLNNMIQTLANMNIQIMEIHQKKIDIQRKSAQSPGAPNQNASSGTTNNIVFTGTTKDLSGFLKNLKDQPIDVEGKIKDE